MCNRSCKTVNCRSRHCFCRWRSFKICITNNCPECWVAPYKQCFANSIFLVSAGIKQTWWLGFLFFISGHQQFNVHCKILLHILILLAVLPKEWEMEHCLSQNRYFVWINTFQPLKKYVLCNINVCNRKVIVLHLSCCHHVTCSISQVASLQFSNPLPWPHGTVKRPLSLDAQFRSSKLLFACCFMNTYYFTHCFCF